MNGKLGVIYIAILLGLVVPFSSGCQGISLQSSLEGSLPTMAVQGEGKVEIVPDEAIVRFGVTSDEKTLSKAYSGNLTKMNAVIELLKKNGLENTDINTSSFTVVPMYSRDENGRQIPGKPVSFRVSQELTVKIREVDETGEIIDAVISSGVNTFNGIQFTSGRIEEFEAEARINAARDAMDKAKALSAALGVKTGRILRVNQSSNRPYPVNRMMAYDVSMARSAPQIEPGSMEITASCDIICEIVQ